MQLVFKIFNLCGHDTPTSQTDRQTDGQTTCDNKTALCTVVHHAVKTVLDRGSRSDWPRWPLTLTYDLQFQSPASHGDPHTCKRWRTKVSRFERQNGNRRTYGRTEAIALPEILTQSV